MERYTKFSGKGEDAKGKYFVSALEVRLKSLSKFILPVGVDKSFVAVYTALVDRFKDKNIMSCLS